MSSSGPGTVIIQGPPPGLWPSNAPPLRREIHDLIQDRKQFSLYIQALLELQKVSQDEVKSWFAISGIHGTPPKVWDNASPKPEKGYCVHGRRLFPTWHRGYVSLFEQTLHEHAVKIASEYTSDKESWITAADTLRAPYWDWAIYILPPVECYVSETLKIITKDGETDFPNPLLSYVFHPPLPPPHDDKQTWRSEGMTDRLKSVEKTIKNDVFKCLTLLKKWDDFSMRTTTKNIPVANSVETLHDGLHVRVGGKGHMALPPVGSFDPLFWLHHANVDRQVALWQGLNPNEWVGEGDPGVETDLVPFWNSHTTFHRSSSVPIKRWTDFRFNYPEYQELGDASPEHIQKVILAKVRELYGPDIPRGGVDLDYIDWFARVRSRVYALHGSYSIFLFFGEPPQSSSEWRLAENMVGVGEVFANPDPESCPTCNENIDSLHECIIYLTDPLKERREYEKPAQDIKTYIQNSLKWRVQKVDGTVVPTAEVPGFDISVETTNLTFSIPRGGHSPMIPVAAEPVQHIHF